MAYFLKVNKYGVKLCIRPECQNNDFAMMLKNPETMHNV